MDDLTLWLTAQLDADTALATAAMSGTWTARTLPGNIEHVHPAFWVEAEYDDGEGVTNATVADCQWSLADAQHIAEWGPARVLREVDAKRGLLAEHAPRDGCCRVCTAHANGQWTRFRAPCTTLRLLALPYADRPGYQEGWAP